MKNMNFCALLLAFTVGCQENETPQKPTGPVENQPEVVKLGLPAVHGAAHCNPNSRITGGDMAALADRVVIGDITAVEFVEVLEKKDGAGDPSQNECNVDQYYWTLKVTIDNVENIKGTGASFDVYITPHEALWASVPMRLVNNVWLPKWPGHTPAVQVTDELAWSEVSGIQVGQRVLLFTDEDRLGHTRTVLPWALEEDGQFAFQESQIDCEEYPSAFHQPFSRETLEGELSTPTQGIAVNPFDTLLTPVTSYCMSRVVDGPDFPDMN